MPANLENSTVTAAWKRSVFIPIPKKGKKENELAEEALKLLRKEEKLKSK